MSHSTVSFRRRDDWSIRPSHSSSQFYGRTESKKPTFPSFGWRRTVSAILDGGQSDEANYRTSAGLQHFERTVFTHGLIRPLIFAVGSLAAGLLLLGAVALLVNLSWFDATLHPELERLKKVDPPLLEKNAYPIALGFVAADDRDPRAAGAKILQALHERFLRGEPISLDPEEMNTFLGGEAKRDDWQNRFKSLDCVARVDLDCADRAIAEVTPTDAQDARLAVLSNRYESMIHEERFVESQERDASTPGPQYKRILDVGRIRLAMSLRQGSTSDLLTKAADDFRFWTSMLREGDTLVAKMISIAGIQNTLDFLSALMRQRELTESEILSIRDFLRPMTSEELDIGEAFLSEARIAVLSEKLPEATSSSWLIRWTLQENASLNEQYLKVIVPMQRRSALTPEEFYRQGANLPLNHDLGDFPLSPFNWGGRMAFRESNWDPEQFVARVQDENGRISLVMLQAELEQQPGAGVRAVVSSSRWRNPYTGEPMEYDPESQTIGFMCLHTAYHPPASPDRCSIAIEPKRN
ncbi:MAG TPA: hypothetical protein VGO61_11510 [Steroidobacteraceae bacterium]|jgi:hypothetical protein|nr:hypothetical protein [Steroidobacteraceae bacterium]